MEVVLDPDRMIAAACDLAKAPVPRNDSFREGLAMLAAGINACAITSEAGRRSIERQAIGYLANRLAVEAYLASHPALLEAPIEKPVFVLGTPRTGTTLMVNLLAQDPAARTLRKWEANLPIPPAKAGELSTDPRCIRLNEERKREVAEGKLQTNVHFEWYDEPTECVFVLMQDFKSTSWDAFQPMPDYSEFLLGCDMEPAYVWHRRFLQHLQENNQGRWTLKAPGHALFARALLKVYPDARLVWMHRDPRTVVASMCSLVSSTHRRFADSADIEHIARFYPRQLMEHVNRMLDVEQDHPDQVFHVLFDDVNDHPLEAMDKLYSDMGLAMDDATRAAVRTWVADHPRGAGGEHKYALEQFGLDDANIEPLFARYNERRLQLEGLGGK